jgi:hypothetical protein
MKETVKNILRNVTPSIAVMVVGLIGAFILYNMKLNVPSASTLANYQPAAGDAAEFEINPLDADKNLIDGEVYPPFPNSN